jgi:hypothetical protein
MVGDSFARPSARSESFRDWIQSWMVPSMLACLEEFFLPSLRSPVFCFHVEMFSVFEFEHRALLHERMSFP